MTRSIATWVGIAAICLAILVVPVMNGATKAAEDTSTAWLTFSPLEKPVRAHASVKDKDCIGCFNSRQQAQRFFIKRGGPDKDPITSTPTATARPARTSSTRPEALDDRGRGCGRSRERIAA